MLRKITGSNSSIFAGSEERNWNSFDISMLWTCVIISLPSLAITAGLTGMGLSPALSILNVMISTAVVLAPSVFVSAAGTGQGLALPDLAGNVLGQKGAVIPILIRSLAGCSWFAAAAWTGGKAAGTLIGTFSSRFISDKWTFRLPSWSGSQEVQSGQFIGFIIFIIAACIVALAGIRTLKKIVLLCGPMVIVAALFIVLWSYNQVRGNMGFWEVLSSGSDPARIRSCGGFAAVFFGGMNVNIIYWSLAALTAPDYSKYASDNKSQVTGICAGMMIPMLLCAFAGTFFSKTCEIVMGMTVFDPTVLLYYSGNRLVLFATAFIVFIAGLNSAVILFLIPAANGLSRPCRRILNDEILSYRAGLVIVLVVSVFITQGWWIDRTGSGFYEVMVILNIILIPIPAVMAADYCLANRIKASGSRLNAGHDNIYDLRESSRHPDGVNRASIIAWIAAIIIPLISYGGAYGGLFTFVSYVSGIWAFAVAFVIYMILGRSGLFLVKTKEG